MNLDRVGFIVAIASGQTEMAPNLAVSNHELKYDILGVVLVCHQFTLPTLSHVTSTPTLREASSSSNCLARVSYFDEFNDTLWLIHLASNLLIS